MIELVGPEFLLGKVKLQNTTVRDALKELEISTVLVRDMNSVSIDKSLNSVVYSDEQEQIYFFARDGTLKNRTMLPLSTLISIWPQSTLTQFAKSLNVGNLTESQHSLRIVGSVIYKGYSIHHTACEGMLNGLGFTNVNSNVPKEDDIVIKENTNTNVQMDFKTFTSLQTPSIIGKIEVVLDEYIKLNTIKASSKSGGNLTDEELLKLAVSSTLDESASNSFIGVVF